MRIASALKCRGSGHVLALRSAPSQRLQVCPFSVVKTCIKGNTTIFLELPQSKLIMCHYVVPDCHMGNFTGRPQSVALAGAKVKRRLPTSTICSLRIDRPTRNPGCTDGNIDRARTVLQPGNSTPYSPISINLCRGNIC